MDIRNGRITNFSRGLVTTHECTRMVIESVDIFGCKQSGMQIGQPSTIWNPPREKMGFVRNCFVAGNGRGREYLRESNLIYAPDLSLKATGLATKPRMTAARINPGFCNSHRCESNNVVCRCNHTGGMRRNSYVNLSAAGSHGNTVENASGISTRSGPWNGLPGRP